MLRPRLPLLCAVAVTLAACGRTATSPSPAPSPAAPVSISVAVPDGALTPGSQVALHATAINADGSSQDVTSQATWRSSNTDVITVSSAGVATIVAEGSADIEASWRGVAGRTALSSRAAAFTVTGVVRDQATGNRLSGVQVEVQGQNVSAVTDADGAFTMRGLRAGTYVLRGERRGYLPAEPSVTVSGDTTIAFALDREASPDPAPSPGPSPVPTTAPVSLTAAVTPAALNLGESATFTIELRNTSADTVTLVFGGCIIQPAILDRLARNVFVGFACTADIKTLVLAPGQTRTWRFPIRATASPAPLSPETELVPGTYTAYAILDTPLNRTLSVRSGDAAFEIR
jgi:hypothetical protein